VTKVDVAADEQVSRIEEKLKTLNPGAQILRSRSGSAALEAFAPHSSASVKTPEQLHHHVHSQDVNRHDEHVRAHSFVLDGPVSWSAVTAWSRLVAVTLGERLLRCKGLLEIADTGEVVFLQGVQDIFHAPERLPGWPDADHRSRLVCITRDVEEAELRRMLAALRLPPGSDPNVRLSDLVAQ
jgi:G3E family GTPase